MSIDLPALKKWTQARIALTRTGNAVSTSDVLKFNLAHALARDAVYAHWNYEKTAQALCQMGENAVCVQSKTTSREEYLKRPDLGRQLSDSSRQLLTGIGENLAFDLCFIISDGLSALATELRLLPFWTEIRNVLADKKYSVAPLVLAPLSRVALGDEIGEHLHAQISVVLIGERPGMTANDSLGIYLTYDPKRGKTDASRNCISNVRPPFGLSYSTAAQQLLCLIEQILKQKLSGIHLNGNTLLDSLT